MLKKRFIFLIAMVFAWSAAYAAPADQPKTGQTTSYATGDDGGLQKGVAWPSPRFTAGTGAEAACVTDNLTGLMWVKSPDGTMRTWADALTYADGLSLCGYTDWRFSNLNELESLVNAGQSNSATWLNTQGFSNVQAVNYWSSTTYAYNTVNAWLVDIYVGRVSTVSKTDNNYVWPVRAEGGAGGSSGTPTAPTATAAAGNNQVTISWSSVTGATSYNIYRSTTSGVTKSNAKVALNVTGASYSDTTAINGITYYYAVTAVSSSGESVLSNEVSAKPSATATAPTITSFNPTSGSVGTQVTITGTNFSTTPANNTVKFNGTTATVTAATATSLTVIVPSGATTGSVTVTTAGGSGTSAGSFTVSTGGGTTTGGGLNVACNAPPLYTCYEYYGFSSGFNCSTMPGTTTVTSCSTSNRIGTCTTGSGSVYMKEYFYTGGISAADAQSTCSVISGTWSAN